VSCSILILASAVFFYGKTDTGSATPASLFDAHDLIRDLVGKRTCPSWSLSTQIIHFVIAAAFLFALALLAAGQSSSLIATVAGQAVAEGFLQWKVSVSVFISLNQLEKNVHAFLDSHSPLFDG
jgi:metal iron transporter